VTGVQTCALPIYLDRPLWERGAQGTGDGERGADRLRGDVVTEHARHVVREGADDREAAQAGRIQRQDRLLRSAVRQQDERPGGERSRGVPRALPRRLEAYDIGLELSRPRGGEQSEPGFQRQHAAYGDVDLIGHTVVRRCELAEGREALVA